LPSSEDAHAHGNAHEDEDEDEDEDAHAHGNAHEDEDVDEDGKKDVTESYLGKLAPPPPLPYTNETDVPLASRIRATAG
jgi:hypothetical protein